MTTPVDWVAHASMRPGTHRDHRGAAPGATIVIRPPGHRAGVAGRPDTTDAAIEREDRIVVLTFDHAVAAGDVTVEILDRTRLTDPSPRPRTTPAACRVVRRPAAGSIQPLDN